MNRRASDGLRRKGSAQRAVERLESRANSKPNNKTQHPPGDARAADQQRVSEAVCTAFSGCTPQAAVTEGNLHDEVRSLAAVCRFPAQRRMSDGRDPELSHMGDWSWIPQMGSR